uniref:NADH dehydrogenase-like complex S n=1 Tax=Populus tomentosa TaxID=118781 RepID=A0A3S9LK73_POPTO|nr:NADH dehydrogenase-like complex S [Populus tomentosa]
MECQTMASSITLQSTLLRSNFLGQNNCFNHPHKPYSLIPKDHRLKLKPCAKLDLFEILGGRGLCNGEKGVQQELERNIEEQASSTAGREENSGSLEKSSVPDDAFEKELMGLTGGFPGGEKGLKRFVEENPPPKKQSVPKLTITSRPKPPELPLLLPGMIAIVKNPNNPFYMYTGIVQRTTDGKAGVIFEGGNWDKLVTFRLEELERREKGPPGKNPRSAIIEAFYETESQSSS